jgi:hypothetical protein
VLRSPCVTASSWTSAGLVAVRPSRASLSLFEGCGVERGRGVGGTALGNDTRHPAQHLYNAGDGRVVAGCSSSAGARFPSGVRRSVWRGFSFDLGAHDVSKHLMLRSGEQVMRHGLREASSETETHLRS